MRASQRAALALVQTKNESCLSKVWYGWSKFLLDGHLSPRSG